MERGACLAVVVGVLGLWGCGGQAADSRGTPEAHGKRGGGDMGSGGGGSEPVPTATGTATDPSPPPSGADDISPYCPSAGFGGADQVVAAGIVGHDLVLVTAAGDRRVAASFHPMDQEDRLSAVVTTADGSVTAMLGKETIRLRADFSVLYQLPVFAGVASDQGVARLSGVPSSDVAFLRADGVAVTFGDPGKPISIDIRGAADEQGWMLAEWSAPDSNTPTTGLANVDRRLRPFFTRAPGASVSMAKLAGQYAYLYGHGAYTLTFGTPSNVVDVPVDVSAWPGKPTTYLTLTGSGAVGVVSSAYDPRLFRVDGAAHTITPITVPEDATAAVTAGVGGRVVVSPDGGSFLGTDTHGAPLWRYDVARDLVTAVNLGDLAPLGPMDGEYCNPPSLVLPHADIGIGLRDRAFAGFYEVAADGSHRRIGRPLRDVIAVAARQVGGAWIVTGNDGKNSYCPGFKPFDEDPSGVAVTGNSVQIVPPEGEPLAFSEKDEWAMGITEIDSGGMCALHQANGTGQESTVYDLGTHAATPFGSFRAFAWLP